MDERSLQDVGGDPAAAWFNETALVRCVVLDGDSPRGYPRSMWAGPLLAELLGPGFAAPLLGSVATVSVTPRHLAAVATLLEKLGYQVPASLNSPRGRRLAVMRVRICGRGACGTSRDGDRWWSVAPCDAQGRYYAGADSDLHFTVDVPEEWLVRRDERGVSAVRLAIEAGAVLERPMAEMEACG